MKRFLSVLVIIWLFTQNASFGEDKLPIPDEPFRQASSVKFRLHPNLFGARLSKVVVDYRENVFVLSDKGLLRDFGDTLAKDLSYVSLAELQPIDITVQTGSGYLYYLYADRFLTNAHAGTICGKFAPGAFERILVAADDTVLLLGKDSGALFHRSEKRADLPLPNGDLLDAQVFGSAFYALTADGLFRLDDKNWTAVHAEKNLTAFAVTKEKIWLAGDDGYFSVTPDGKPLAPPTASVPVLPITRVADCSGELWFTTNDGAFRKDADRYRYFAHQRWLDQNRVIDIASDAAGNVYLLTETGLNKIAYVRETLAEKAAKIQKNIEKYHIRFGWSAASRRIDPTDETTLTLRDSDNDGLWTSIWLGSQAFRYAVTKDESARRNVWESFEAFERNLSIHSVEGFSARTFERKGFNASDPKAWRDAPDSDWVWKGTTSTDEVVGYIFVADLIDRFVAQTPEEKKRVADYLDAILTHVLKHDYYLVDADGRPTLWARWNPDYVNRFAKTQFDRKLNSTLLSAMLQLGYRLTGKKIYREELARVWKEWGYRDNMMTPMSEIKYTEGFQHEGVTLGLDWNHSDDEMAFLTYWVLCQTALDEKDRKDYDWMVADHWEIERPEENALWNVIAYALCGKIDAAATVGWLRGFNLDRRNWRMINSHRADVVMKSDDLRENFRQQRTERLLPQEEQRIMRHNGNAFSPDGGGNGDEELTGEEFLLPYWMCRFFRVIE